MSKRIKVTKSKFSESFSIIDDYTDPQTKKRSTFSVEPLGNLDFLKKKYNTDSREAVMIHLQEYVNMLKALDKEERETINVPLSQSHLIPLDSQRIYNIGELFPRNILFSLGIRNICDQISSRHKYKFDLCRILADLVTARIIYPESKRSTYDDASHFLNVPTYKLHHLYRSLPLLANERYFIQSELYKNSEHLYDRNTSILYYDCTNFYFEIEEEYDMCMYGKCKENRPNPIVQYGLFMDANGMPIADIVFNGNMNEQFSMKELEERIEKDFKFSQFIVCADAGLNGWENKIYNDKKANGAYIVTQPIKKLKGYLKDWATDPKGWKILNHDELFDISQLEDTMKIDGKIRNTDDIIFYKERWIKQIKKSKETNKPYTLEEHLIVTFSNKYRKYQKHIRAKKLERAVRLLKNPGNIKTSDPRNPKYYIKKITTTQKGEVANEDYYSIDEDKIANDERYDGLYGVTTDLEDNDLPSIIKANKQRWEIEENFEIMKSELKTRPMYVTKEESIKGHLLICFISLLVYRILEKEYLKEEYTCNEIIGTLREMNITHIVGSNYIPSFTRTELVDKLAEIFGFQPSREVLTQKYLNKFLRIINSRKSTKLK